jgi:magnesium transporter
MDRDWTRAGTEMSGRTHLEVADEEIFFELSALGTGPLAPWQSLAFLCGPGRVITIHPQPMEDLAEVVDRVVRNSGSPVRDNSTLVAALLAALSRRTVDAAADVRDAMREVQRRLDRDPDQVAVDEIQDLSTVIRTLDRVVGERTVILDRLRVLEGRPLDLSDMADFRVAVADTHYLDRVIDRLEKGVTDLRVRFSLHQQDRTNRRLAILTVLSAVFLPLTLLAGIYGMNFEFMPELEYHYAYFAALGAMAIIAVGMIVYFRRRGWFD